MMVHVDLRLTHIELAKRLCQRLTVDMNHHTHPLRGHRGVDSQISVAMRPHVASRRDE